MPRFSRMLSLVPAVLFLAAPAANATTIKVNNSGDGSTGCTLRAAVEDVDSPGVPGSPCGPVSPGPSEIMLGQGTFTLTEGAELVVAPPADLTIVGTGESATTISADGLNRVFAIAPGAALWLRDMTLDNGEAPAGASGSTVDPGAVQGGGAILNLGDLTVADTAITNSYAGAGEDGASTDGATGGDGGGIYNTGSLMLIGVTMIGNGAGLGGDGTFATSGSTFTFAGGGEGGNGGAVANVGGELTVQDSTFIDDLAGSGGQGGAGSSLQGAEVAGGPGGGGGDGGAIWTAAGAVSIVNSTLSSNSAGAGGIGGFAAADGAGGDGGAVAAGPSSAVMLESDTIVANSAPGVGGGIFAPAPAGSGYALGGISAQNTLLALNVGGNCAARALVDAGGNLGYGDTSCPSRFRSGNPNLRELGDNGGPGETIGLGAGSAAIGTGAGCPSVDARGVPRIGLCDIGAYQPARPSLRVRSASASASSARIVAFATLYAGSGTITVRYQTGNRRARVLTVKLGPGVAPVRALVTVRGLVPGTAYRYSIKLTTVDGSSLSVAGRFRTTRRPTHAAKSAHARVRATTD